MRVLCSTLYNVSINKTKFLSLEKSQIIKHESTASVVSIEQKRTFIINSYYTNSCLTSCLTYLTMSQHMKFTVNIAFATVVRCPKRYRSRETYDATSKL